MIVILGVHDGHDSSAALMVDGKIISAAQEERFTGLKMECGYPAKAIDFCLKLAGIDISEIDQVAIGSENFLPVLYKVKREANFSVEDRILEQHAYWKPRLIDNENPSYWDLFKDRDDFVYCNDYPIDHLLDNDLNPEQLKEAGDIRQQAITNLLGVSGNRISRVNHEICHIFYGYLSSSIRDLALCLTCESFGDKYNSTVSKISIDDHKFLATSDKNDLGRLYSNMTLLLGMKPMHHEYKVMGLAPYANDRDIQKSFDVFKTLLKLDGLNIVADQRPRDLYFHYKDALEGHRFDGIAGGLQKFTEYILCNWLEACLMETGLNRVVFSGGVAQNIKACMSMSALDGVEEFSVSPASGDTTLSMGACYWAAWQETVKNGGNLDGIGPLENIYLGPAYESHDIEEVLRKRGVQKKFTVKETVTAAEIARYLADGKILGRCAGRMEFGPRALGNRSILADPRNSDTIRKINAAIKHRDFWMPFTPTILAERASDYVVNPKGLASPFMTMAFPSTKLAQKDLVAALHPADMTMRPQILEEHINPEYYALIKEFEKITGVGGVLNTSFNLHGHPIVLGPEEALFTLENSDLDGVVIENFLVTRKPQA